MELVKPRATTAHPEMSTGRGSSLPTGGEKRSPPTADGLAQSVPVFTYHNALLGELTKDLRFLADNGYATVLASEVVDILHRRRPAPLLVVALTFDDALRSVREVALPLLQQYGMRATIFAITGFTPERAGPAAARSAASGEVLAWSELQMLAESGIFEVGSHGHRHNPVHVSGRSGRSLRLAGYRRSYDAPVPYGPDCGPEAVLAAEGKPERPSAPLFAAKHLFVDGKLVDAERFIRADLDASRQALQQHLGIERAHLCPPYGAGNRALPRLARDCGFESIFWTRQKDRKHNRPGDDPYGIVRRKADFLRRLPGRGRRSLAELFLYKTVRRLRRDPFE
ncbi:MAG: polysaccharide deacetylase family protein [Acidobacteriota bacterium]